MPQIPQYIINSLSAVNMDSMIKEDLQKLVEYLEKDTSEENKKASKLVTVLTMAKNRLKDEQN